MWLAGRVIQDLSIPEPYRPGCALHHQGIVGGEKKRGPLLPVEFPHEVEQGCGRLGVQVCRRLVGQNDPGPCRDGPRHGHTLLLPPAQLKGAPVFHPLETHCFQERETALLSFLLGHFLEQKDELRVLVGREDGDQVVCLEYETDVVEPESTQVSRPQAAHLGPVEPDLALVRAVQPTQQVQECGFP